MEETVLDCGEPRPTDHPTFMAVVPLPLSPKSGHPCQCLTFLLGGPIHKPQIFVVECFTTKSQGNDSTDLQIYFSILLLYP